jgi:hypothetical protein
MASSCEHGNEPAGCTPRCYFSKLGLEGIISHPARKCIFCYPVDWRLTLPVLPFVVFSRCTSTRVYKNNLLPRQKRYSRKGQ